MQAKFKVIKLTEENQALYLDQIAALEVKVLERMEQEGKIGQLFITGKDDIAEYVKSKDNSVMVAVDENNNVISAAYITHGQEPFTYNDITKYFKYGEDYQESVKQDLDKHMNYRMMMAHCYCLKIMAFEKAKEIVLRNHPEYQSITQYINHEINSENGFDEKNELRENINKYMSMYMQKIEFADFYEKFYWVTYKDILREFGAKGKPENEIIKEYEYFLEHAQLDIHSTNLENPQKYYISNTSNAIELDTYITDPESRHSGLARILVYEGIKNKILEGFNDDKKQEIYLCSTLHKDNLSSKYVSEFFGLTDSVFAKRRTNRDREVHIYRIDRKNYKQYLEDLEDKLIVLYDYKPNMKIVPVERKLEIIDNQLKYEQAQYIRLNKIRNDQHNYSEPLNDNNSLVQKLKSMGKLKQKRKEIIENSQEQGDTR